MLRSAVGRGAILCTAVMLLSAAGSVKEMAAGGGTGRAVESDVIIGN